MQFERVTHTQFAHTKMFYHCLCVCVWQDHCSSVFTDLQIANTDRFCVEQIFAGQHTKFYSLHSCWFKFKSPCQTMHIHRVAWVWNKKSTSHHTDLCIHILYRGYHQIYMHIRVKGNSLVGILFIRPCEVGAISHFRRSLAALLDPPAPWGSILSDISLLFRLNSNTAAVIFYTTPKMYRIRKMRQQGNSLSP